MTSLLEKLRKQHKRKIAVFVVFAGCGLVVFGAYGLIGYFRATHHTNPTIPSEVVTYSTETPDETPIKNACDTNKVPDNEPRLIEIQAIGVSACIQKVGLDQKGAVAVPSNIHLAGWFVKSVPPGSEGNSIIDGHLSGRYASAVFSNLAKLRDGDRIKIQMGNNTWREFTVTLTKSIPADQAGDLLFAPVPPNVSQLTLITCGGKYDKQQQTYEDRVIVRATSV